MTDDEAVSALISRTAERLVAMSVTVPYDERRHWILPIWREFAHELLTLSGYRCTETQCFLRLPLEEQRRIVRGTLADLDELWAVLNEAAAEAALRLLPRVTATRGQA